MKFIADFHIHSHFSRATSRNLTVEQLHKWAQLKGLQVVGTGDLTHPGWLEELKTRLEPAEDGLFRLKEEYARAMEPEVFPACQQPVRFILSGEISNIYKKHEKTRKNHNVVFLPSFDAVERFQAALEKIGNIRSDGRPILGLDARDLLEIVLETDPQAQLIPAHIWTPWFSLLGSKSGFDTIEECFEDLTPHIFALETGLSTDPPMNWRLSALDRYTLVSNSDAHSPQKLAREANLFDTELSYAAIFDALKSGNPETFLGTIEFFPQEGKYHYDGHRKCQICWDPKITLAHDGICPVCGKKVTVGVMNRIEALADCEEGRKPDSASPFYSLIPLPEILSEAYGVGPNTKRVNRGYEFLLTHLGSELSILRDVPIEDIARLGGGFLGEGIRRMRSGKVIADAGYDGEYGVIRLFEHQERTTLTSQLGFFAVKPAARPEKKQSRPHKTHTKKTAPTPPIVREPALEYSSSAPAEQPDSAILRALNPDQREAVLCTDSSLIIIAGPGTGKTRTITHRMAYLLTEQGVAPAHLLAITFTNKAAEEMAVRLRHLVGEALASQIVINTFHAFCAMILREQAASLALPSDFAICAEQDRSTVLKQARPELQKKEIAWYLDVISSAKNQGIGPETDPSQCREFLASLAETASDTEDVSRFFTIYQAYQSTLREDHLIDFDDLIFYTVRLFETQPEAVQRYQTRFRWIAVDEYQDLNRAQYRLLTLLKTPETNLCVIGDPDQAIYGFRGANREYFLRFQEDFPDAKRFRLSQNYRSTQAILDASRQVIEKNPDRAALEIWSEFITQTTLDIYQAPTYKAEAEYVVHEIEKMVGGTTLFSMDSGRVDSSAEGSWSFGDFAVLYRLGAQSQPLFEAFQRSGIPYQIVGQASLYDHSDIREILAYLWLLAAPDSRLHWEIVNGRHQGNDLFLHDLHASRDSQPVTALIERIYAHISGGTSEPGDQQTTRLNRLLANAAPFGSGLAAFLDATALHKETDDYDPRADRVTLMSLHASKGLEFPVVFIVGCEETLLPYQRQGQPVDLEEERRLFYVGLTRARRKLILTHAQKRFLFGNTMQNAPSRFLNDIETALKTIQYRAKRPKPAKPKEQSQLKLFGE